LNALEVQERDLETAERVLTSLEAEQEPELALVEAAVATTITPQPGKPEGIPTMPEMIKEALKDARSRGLKGLEPKEITSFIAAKWWPTVTINSVGPIAWRMYDREQLAKRQSKYSLPKTIDETVDNNAAA
jgi:hypothetical protein